MTMVRRCYVSSYDITNANHSNPDLENLLSDDFFNKTIHTAQLGWRDVLRFVEKAYG